MRTNKRRKINRRIPMPEIGFTYELEGKNQKLFWCTVLTFCEGKIYLHISDDLGVIYKQWVWWHVFYATEQKAMRKSIDK